MKPNKRPARRTPKPDDSQAPYVPSPRPFRSDRPGGPNPLRRGQQKDAPPTTRRWSPDRPQKPWAKGPHGSPQRAPRPGKPAGSWPRAGESPQRGPRPPHPRAQRGALPPHARPGGKPVIKEHPQYGTRIPPEELEYLNHQQRQQPQRTGRPAARAPAEAESGREPASRRGTAASRARGGGIARDAPGTGDPFLSGVGGALRRTLARRLSDPPPEAPDVRGRGAPL